MKYKDIYKKACKLASSHLDSMEVYDEFEPEDAKRIERAILEIQRQLQAKSEKRTRLTKAEYKEIETKEERLREELDKRMSIEFGELWFTLKRSIIGNRLDEIWAELNNDTI